MTYAACRLAHVAGKLNWLSRPRPQTHQGLLDRCDSLFDVGNELGVVKDSSVSADASTDQCEGAYVAASCVSCHCCNLKHDRQNGIEGDGVKPLFLTLSFGSLADTSLCCHIE